MKEIVTLVVGDKVADQFSSIRSAYRVYRRISGEGVAVHYSTFCRRLARLGHARAFNRSTYTKEYQWHSFHTQVDNIDTDTKPLHANEESFIKGEPWAPAEDGYPDLSTAAGES